MRKAILLIGLFFSSICCAQLGAVDMNAGQDPPSYVSTIGNACPHPLTCDYGTNFLHLSDANRCGCCGCHGGSTGCAGGAHGQIVCADGTYAQGCGCQYTVNTD